MPDKDQPGKDHAGEKQQVKQQAMQQAIAAAAVVRGSTAPNPWVGAVLLTADGQSFTGATEPPFTGATEPPVDSARLPASSATSSGSSSGSSSGTSPGSSGRHAEVVALDAAKAAGASTDNAVLYVTLEPCCHTGRTPPCTEAIIAAGISEVVVGIVDPDTAVAGAGIAALRAADIAVELLQNAQELQDAQEHAASEPAGRGTSELASQITNQLAPYLHHRRTGLPWVVLKLAATADGRTAAADGSSQWITGEAARTDVHRLRARCDTVLVGAGTVRADDPLLTVRLNDGRLNGGGSSEASNPRRVVLGTAPPEAAIHPCWEMSGAPADVLNELGKAGVVELLIEGGANVAAQFHQAGLVNEYVIYLAPALMGGDDGLAMFAGAGAQSIKQLWRGQLTDVIQLDGDLRITLRPKG